MVFNDYMVIAARVSAIIFLEAVIIGTLHLLKIRPEKPNKVRATLSFFCFLLSTLLYLGTQSSAGPSNYEKGYEDGYHDGKKAGRKAGMKAGIEKGRELENEEWLEHLRSASSSSSSGTYESNESDGPEPEQETGDEKSVYIAQCQSLDYNSILRNPDRFDGTKTVVSGTVDQIVEGLFGSFTIYVADGNGNKWGCLYSYDDGESRLIEEDSVTMYGECTGTSNVDTVLGKQVTLPTVDVKYID